MRSRHYRSSKSKDILLRMFWYTAGGINWPISKCTDWTDFDVTAGRLQNQGCFQGVYCNTAGHRFCIITFQHFRPFYTQFLVLQYIF